METLIVEEGLNRINLIRAENGDSELFVVVFTFSICSPFHVTVGSDSSDTKVRMEHLNENFGWSI